MKRSQNSELLPFECLINLHKPRLCILHEEGFSPSGEGVVMPREAMARCQVLPPTSSQALPTSGVTHQEHDTRLSCVAAWAHHSALDMIVACSGARTPDVASGSIHDGP